MFPAFLGLGYLCGSIPFAKIIGYLYGVDIQKKGSGNIGFANTYRVLGPKPALVVFVGDVGKGFIPTLLTQSVHLSPIASLSVGVAAILGHIFPVWLRFQGGKGMATGLGVLLAVSPKLALLGFLTWLVILTTTKIFSLASLSAAFVVFLLSIIFPDTHKWTPWIFTITLFGLFLHRANIKRIVNGTEPKSWKW